MYHPYSATIQLSSIINRVLDSLYRASTCAPALLQYISQSAQLLSIIWSPIISIHNAFLHLHPSNLLAIYKPQFHKSGNDLIPQVYGISVLRLKTSLSFSRLVINSLQIEFHLFPFFPTLSPKTTPLPTIIPFPLLPQRRSVPQSNPTHPLFKINISGYRHQKHDARVR